MKTIEVKIDCGDILCGRCQFKVWDSDQRRAGCVLFGKVLVGAEPHERCQECRDGQVSDG